MLSANVFGAEVFPDVSQLPVQANPPDPLVSLDGKRITTRKEWFEKRRPELKRLFEHYMYGTSPMMPGRARFTVEREGEDFFNGKAVGKEVMISFGDATNAPRIHLLLVVPKREEKRASDKIPQTGIRGAASRHSYSFPTEPRWRGFPVFLGMNFCGNFAVTSNRDVALPDEGVIKACPGCVNGRATEAGRGGQTDMWAIEQSIDRGYAVATYYCSDVEPDMTNAMTGVRTFLGCGSSQPAPKDSGVIAAWAWGISRAVDYLVTDKDIDAKRIAVVGHSRLGKATTVAGAFDERIALTVPLQAGTGGTGPNRGKTGESVKAINDRFPHWFNDEFKKFNAEPERLPFDQNCLIAMIAPRAVLIGCATEDNWSNPIGQFEMMKGADAAYRFLGAGGLDAKEMPAVNHLIVSRLGYFIRPGKHSMTRLDWKYFLDYADKMMP